MLLTILLVVQAIVAALLVGFILVQQSEGGGLGMGGSPTGLMSARGTADFLTRATTILAAIFVSLSILHAVLAAQGRVTSTIDTSLAHKGAPSQPLQAPVAPRADPLAIPAPGAPATPLPALGAVPTPAPTVTQPQPAARVERLKPTPKRVEPKREADAPAPIAPAPAVPSGVVSPPVEPTPTPTRAPGNGN